MHDYSNDAATTKLKKGSSMVCRQNPKQVELFHRPFAHYPTLCVLPLQCEPIEIVIRQ